MPPDAEPPGGTRGTLETMGALPTPSDSPTRSGAGPSDAALVVAARAGEAWAREALCRRYASTVIGLAHRLLGRDDEADDLAQEAFAQALASLQRLDDPQAFALWIKRIVVRTSHKMLRRRALMRRFGLGRQRDALDVEALVGRDAPPDVRAELVGVYGLIERLPARVRMVLVLRRVDGLGHEEVAAMLRVSLSTAKRLAAQADTLLAAALEEPSPRRKP